VDGLDHGVYASWAVRAIRLFIALSPLALAGCVFFASFDDLRGGSASDAGDADDAVVADTASSSDGPVDAGVDSWIDPATWCGQQPKHDLCDDFDQAGLGERWSGLSAVNGTLTLDMAAAQSRPFALLAVSEAGVVPDLRLKVTRPTLHDVTCEFEVHLDELGPTGTSSTLAIFEIIVKPTDFRDYFIRIQIGTIDWIFNDYGQLPDGGEFFHNYPIPTLGTGEWRKVKIAYDLGGGNGSVAIQFQDKPVFTQALRTPQQGSYTLGVGGHSLNPMVASSKVRIDNVACDFDKR
jgi:hypothetical protein